jgi:calcineurin-like phosphoesterase family protein
VIGEYMGTFITSDHHFKHTNIMKYCHRDFPDIATHDDVLINEWNSVVGEHDNVFHLGDFTLRESIADLIYRLNGNISILSTSWHHDHNWLKHSSTKQLVEFGKIDLMESIVVIESKKLHPELDVPIVMCHYPFEVWDRKHYGAIHFHGHSHGELHKIDNRLDVGIDSAYKLLGSYRPFALEEALAYSIAFVE